MPQDNDARALSLAADALFAIEVKARTAPGVMERVALEDERERLREAYYAARDKLIASGIVVSDQELAEMAALTRELEQAANTNATVEAALKLVGWFANFA